VCPPQILLADPNIPEPTFVLIPMSLDASDYRCTPDELGEVLEQKGIEVGDVPWITSLGEYSALEIVVNRLCLEKFKESFGDYRIDSDYDPMSLDSDEVKAVGQVKAECRFLQRAADATKNGWQPGASMGYRVVLESQGLQERFEEMCRDGGNKVEQDGEQDGEWVLMDRIDSLPLEAGEL